jgi:hypothetical protein
MSLPLARGPRKPNGKRCCARQAARAVPVICTTQPACSGECLNLAPPRLPACAPQRLYRIAQPLAADLGAEARPRLEALRAALDLLAAELAALQAAVQETARAVAVAGEARRAEQAAAVRACVRCSR